MSSKLIVSFHLAQLIESGHWGEAFSVLYNEVVVLIAVTSYIVGGVPGPLTVESEGL